MSTIHDLPSISEMLADKFEDFLRLLPKIPHLSKEDRAAIVDAALHKDSINDRYLLLERVLVIMSSLGKSGATDEMKALSDMLQRYVINLLYTDLPHPPSAYLSQPIPSSEQEQPFPSKEARDFHRQMLAEGKKPKAIPYVFRPADGSYNNPLHPTFGRAGSPYARSVPALSTLPPSLLPDAGLVFDNLLSRPVAGTKDHFVPHPAGVSGLFFAYADLIIHCLFWTDSADRTRNKTSSYLDLNVLYGNNDDEMDSIRSKDGCGGLWPDVFADSRLLSMPPSVCALLVLFNRNHNYTAQKIYTINENHTYKDPATFPDTPEGKRLKVEQDDEIFSKARLVNCGFFMQVILRDYVGVILGLSRDDSDWRLDPLAPTRAADHSLSQRGEGNVVAIEFNILYRWHSSLSEEDTAWTEKFLREKLGGKDPAEISKGEFMSRAAEALRPVGGVKAWTFGGLRRESNGRFPDAGIAKIIQSATASRAGAFRARGVPSAMRVLEILGIEQARAWGTCTLNEFRQFVGLKPYSTFAEWNSDKSIAAAAKKLYGHIDNMELHPGLHAEEPKAPGPGAGLCPGYTLSRAILADAVCLTRGDRFMTTDCTPHNMTTWGYLDTKAPANDGASGGMLTKLLYRLLPNFYPARSVYAQFPFSDPAYLKTYMVEKHPNGKAAGQARMQQYDWTRPSDTPQRVVVVDTYESARKVLSDTKTYATGIDERLKAVIGGTVPSQTAKINDILLQFAETFGQSLEKDIKTRLEENSLSRGKGKMVVDVLKDVIRVSVVRWVCGNIVGIPLDGTKTGDENDNVAIFNTEEWFSMFEDIAESIYVNVDRVTEWTLRASSKTAHKRFVDTVKSRIDRLGSILNNILGAPVISKPAEEFLKAVHKKFPDDPHGELANAIFCAVVPTVALWVHTVIGTINLYVDGTTESLVRGRAELAAFTGTYEDKQAKITSLVKTATSLESFVPGVYRTVLKDDILPNSVKVAVGDRVFVNIALANKDDARPANSETLAGIPVQGLLASQLFTPVATRAIAAILSLKDVKPGPGSLGKFNAHQGTIQGTSYRQYVGSEGKIKPWPESLLIEYTV